MTLSKLLCVASLLTASTLATADPTARVTQRIDDYKAANTFKGAVVAVVKGGATYWYNYGWKDNTSGISVTTPVAVASLTKTMVGAELVMEDQKAGGTDELTTLDALVPIYPGMPTNTVTLRDLATMMGGLQRPTPDWVTNVDQLWSSLSVCAAGQCSQPKPTYSNWGYTVLGNILAMVEGTADWSALNKAWVTTPLGMAKTCARGDGCHPDFTTSHAHPFDANGNELPLPDFSDLTAPEGGMWSTAEDMAIWMRYQLHGVTGSSAAITRLNNALPRQRQQFAGGFGYSWRFTNVTGHGITHPVRWKLGHYAGFSSYLGICDDADAAVFVFVNADPQVGTEANPPDQIMRTALAEPILGDFFLANP